MNRVLNLQALENNDSLQGKPGGSSCSWAGCGGCSSASFSGCSVGQPGQRITAV